MTSYKVDISIRLLVQSHMAVEAAVHGMSEAEALRRMFQAWYEENILPTVKQKATEMQGRSISEVSVFDNANAHVELD